MPVQAHRPGKARPSPIARLDGHPCIVRHRCLHRLGAPPAGVQLAQQRRQLCGSSSKVVCLLQGLAELEGSVEFHAQLPAVPVLAGAAAVAVRRGRTALWPCLPARWHTTRALNGSVRPPAARIEAACKPGKPELASLPPAVTAAAASSAANSSGDAPGLADCLSPNLERRSVVAAAAVFAWCCKRLVRRFVHRLREYLSNRQAINSCALNCTPHGNARTGDWQPCWQCHGLEAFVGLDVCIRSCHARQSCTVPALQGRGTLLASLSNPALEQARAWLSPARRQHPALVQRCSLAETIECPPSGC